ncbi:hypothetical protein BaRGS_00007631 [Batillaria attramentaria]|uniref:EGF-like domain-containing protein n=1 Tax=Batillaria attramentaria TaxID=370345 RepID=A0ABD0LNW2_9CAEN
MQFMGHKTRCHDSIRVLLMLVLFPKKTRAVSLDEWIPFGIKCYFFSTDTTYRNFKHTLAYGHSPTVHAAKPTTMEIYNFLATTALKVGGDEAKFYIGVWRHYGYWDNKPVSSIDLASTLGEPFTLNSTWAPGHPRGSYECVELYKKRLYSLSCRTIRPYIVETLARNDCDSDPCQHGGVCTKMCVGYRCACGEMFYGPNCAGEYLLPGALHTNCSDWVAEFKDLTCVCSAEVLGYPEALVGWNFYGNDSLLARTVFIKSVQRRDSRNYVCQSTWIRPNSAAKLVKTLPFRPRVAYGPTDNDTVIEGAMKEFESTGVEDFTLRCFSTCVQPEPDVEWGNVRCFQGNHFPNCTCQPDPDDRASNMTVTCTLTNPIIDARSRGSAAVYIKVIWRDAVKIKSLTVEGEEKGFATNITAQKLRLECVAYGSPRPNKLEVYRIPGRNTTAKKGGARLEGTEKKGVSKYELAKTYTVRSPGECQGVDTYRCEGGGTSGTDVQHIAISSNCSRGAEAQKLPLLATVASTIAGSLAGLGTIFGGVMLARKRSRRVARQNMISQAVARERQLHNEQRELALKRLAEESLEEQQMDNDAPGDSRESTQSGIAEIKGEKSTETVENDARPTVSED